MSAAGGICPKHISNNTTTTKGNNEMNITNLRQEALNSMSVEIDGQKFRIVGDAEISRHEATNSIPGCLKNVETLDEVRDNLCFYDRRLIARK